MLVTSPTCFSSLYFPLRHLPRSPFGSHRCFSARVPALEKQEHTGCGNTFRFRQPCFRSPFTICQTDFLTSLHLSCRFLINSCLTTPHRVFKSSSAMLGIVKKSLLVLLFKTCHPVESNTQY
jgi:hypothetical protein